MRTNRVLPAAVVSVTVLALTGCGGDEGHSEIPTAASGGATTSSAGSDGQGGDDVAAYVQAQRTYVKCLRDNRVDAPDPDEKGNTDFGGNRHLKKDATFRTATEKCAERATSPSSPPSRSR